MSGLRRGDSLMALAIMLSTLVVAATSVGAAPRFRSTGRHAPAAATVAPDHIVVRGRVLYIDQQSDRNHPAAGVKVQIWDKDERGFTTGEKLAEAETDAGGFFESEEILNEDPDGPTNQPEGTQDVFIKIFTDNGTVAVYQTGTNMAYQWTSYEIDAVDGLSRNVPDGEVGLPTLVIAEDTPKIEALWAYVSLVEGWQFMKDRTGVDPGGVRAYWSRTSQDGPRYDADERAIYLSDADAGFRQVVVQQEAYAFLHTVYGTLPDAWAGLTAGPTTGLKGATDAAGAFVQGFATFFALATYQDPVFESIQLASLDLDAAKAGSAGWENGDTVPGRVAGALWDLFEDDETNADQGAFEEVFDVSNASFDDIWEAVSTAKPTTFAEWWAAWLALGKEGCHALGSLFQNTIDYNTPLQLDSVPDIVMDEDETFALDLADYVSDAECPDVELTYMLVDAGAPEAGVKLVHPTPVVTGTAVGATSVVSVTPQVDWFGATNVSVRISDGPAAVFANFRVIVNSVNDCPEITPRIRDPQPVQHGQPHVLNLLPHAIDVEDDPLRLRWDVELDDQDAQVITVGGRGTSNLTFTLSDAVITAYNARVRVFVTDTEGCETEQFVVLIWTRRPNKPPFIWPDRWTEEYVAPINQAITVDLHGVATDDEDGPDPLEWYVVPETLDHAQFTRPNPDDFQLLGFEPDVGFLGSDRVELEVVDTEGARTTAGITLTWKDPRVFQNLPPRILRNRLLGKTVGKNAAACFDLTDKATDPDDPVASLRWFIDSPSQGLTVDGGGSQQLCLTPRFDFEGCLAETFVVRDPKGAEDTHEVRTCWRTINLVVPFIAQRKSGP